MKNKFLRLLLLAVVVTGITLVIIYRDQLDATVLEQWISDAGSAGPVVFMLIYAVATVFFLPGSVLTLAGGALFGPLWGTVYNLTGATLGAALAFLIARYLAADWVAQKTGGRLKQLVDGVENEGWRFVAFVRLVPLFPFNLLNYALGITRIKFSHYVIASYICMLPGALAYTYLGYALKEAIGKETDIQGYIQLGIIATALLAVAAYLPRMIARLRRGSMLDVNQLKQRLDNGDDVLVLDVRATEDFIGEQGHIGAATNIPVEVLSARLDQLSDRMERPIAIVCRTDRRSVQAAQILTRNGYADVHVVRGGMTLWNEAGYAVER